MELSRLIEMTMTLLKIDKHKIQNIDLALCTQYSATSYLDLFKDNL